MYQLEGSQERSGFNLETTKLLKVACPAEKTCPAQAEFCSNRELQAQLA